MPREALVGVVSGAGTVVCPGGASDQRPASSDHARSVTSQPDEPRLQPRDRRRMGKRLAGLPAREIRSPRDSTALAGATCLPLGGRLRRFGVLRALLGSHLPNNERSGVYLAVELALPLPFALLLAFLGCRHGFFLLVTRNDTPSGASSRRSVRGSLLRVQRVSRTRSIPAIGTSELPPLPASVGAACCDLGVALRDKEHS
jgi:hypothetical protein